MVVGSEVTLAVPFILSFAFVVIIVCGSSVLISEVIEDGSVCACSIAVIVVKVSVICDQKFAPNFGG